MSRKELHFAAAHTHTRALHRSFNATAAASTGCVSTASQHALASTAATAGRCCVEILRLPAPWSRQLVRVCVALHVVSGAGGGASDISVLRRGGVAHPEATVAVAGDLSSSLSPP